MAFYSKIIEKIRKNLRISIKDPIENNCKIGNNIIDDDMARGEDELIRGNLNEAVKCWEKAIDDNHHLKADAFRYLYLLSNRRSFSNYASAFLNYADGLRPGKISLSLAQRLQELERGCFNCNLIDKILDEIALKYFNIRIRNEKRIESDLGDFIKDCLIRKYTENPDQRKWNSDPRFQDILEPFNNGNYLKACEEAEKLSKEYSDFELLYWWWAGALIKLECNELARQILLTGLEKSKGKWHLCNRLGELKWKEDYGKDAVYWWAQAMHCQESLDDFGQDSGAYLYLHYFADGVGLSNYASAFIDRADKVRPGKVRLDDSHAQSLRSLAYKTKGAVTEGVIKGLFDKYFATRKPKMEDSSLDAEIEHLIKLLDINQNDNHRSREEAAKRLGEIGDSRAIGPLMAANRDISLGVKMEAKEALKKIKGKLKDG